MSFHGDLLASGAGIISYSMFQDCEFDFSPNKCKILIDDLHLVKMSDIN